LGFYDSAFSERAGLKHHKKGLMKNAQGKKEKYSELHRLKK